MKVVKVALKENPYSIYIERGIFSKIPSLIDNLSLGERTYLVLTSERIYNIYKSDIKRSFPPGKYKVMKIKDGERTKSIYYTLKVINELMKLNKNRRAGLICLGGGVIGDLGGFAASIYKRGIPYFQIPTTLLAQIDAGIGGKTAVNLAEAKNIIGIFYQPKGVFVDPNFLHTLSDKEIKEGLSEAIKYGIIRDRVLFEFLEKKRIPILKHRVDALFDTIIFRCVKIKARIVSCDEKEKKGIRTILNFGHTVAHGLEAFSRYNRLSHGEAVAWGMISAANLSCYLGICSEGIRERIKNIIISYSLIKKIKINIDRVVQHILYDKKFKDKGIRMVLVSDLGKVVVREGISPSLLRKAIRELNYLL